MKIVTHKNENGLLWKYVKNTQVTVELQQSYEDTLHLWSILCSKKDTQKSYIKVASQAVKSYKMPELSFLCISLHFNQYSPGLSPCCVWILADWGSSTVFFCKTVSVSALAEQHSVTE